MADKGHLFIISGPSGAGKSTILNIILKNKPELRYSTSYTTRRPRGDEQDGLDYYFISKVAFLEKIDSGELAEWAEVHGHFYGSSAKFLGESLGAGHDVIFDIDVEGAKKLYAKYPEAILIFISPPSLDDLKTRLIKRGTDSSDIVERRVRNAEAEMAAAHHYHHVIVNDDIAGTVSRVEAVMEKGSLHG